MNMFRTINKIRIALNYLLIPLLVSACFISSGFAQETTTKQDSAMVQKFYTAYAKPLFWMSSPKYIKRANEWMKLIEDDNQSGFVFSKTETDQIHAVLATKKLTDNALKDKTDKRISGLVLSYIKFLQEGKVIFDYDEVSVPRDSVYVAQLLANGQRTWPHHIISKIECKDHDYLVLKKYLHDSIPDKNSVKYKTILLAMNYRKYIVINRKSEYILANIPSTEAEYYKDGLLTVKMRTVVGKKLKPTPTIASKITSIVTFPNWNVPHEIAVKEILPKVQKDDDYLEQNNFDVVDAKGNEVDDSELNWKNFNEKNFPYYFRQSSGADNSLGLLKFNIGNPFSIFLHSTSWQGAFAKETRFLSHGCIRLEKPFELATDMLRGNIDLDELRSGKKNMESKTIKLPHKIPVFIIYSPVKVDGKKVIFLKDVYGLIK